MKSNGQDRGAIGVMGPQTKLAPGQWTELLFFSWSHPVQRTSYPFKNCFGLSAVHMLVLLRSGAVLKEYGAFITVCLFLQDPGPLFHVSLGPRKND